MKDYGLFLRSKASKKSFFLMRRLHYPEKINCKELVTLRNQNFPHFLRSEKEGKLSKNILSRLKARWPSPFPLAPSISSASLFYPASQKYLPPHVPFLFAGVFPSTI